MVRPSIVLALAELKAQSIIEIQTYILEKLQRNKKSIEVHVVLCDLSAAGDGNYKRTAGRQWAVLLG